MIIKEEKEDFLVEEILDENIISETATNYHIYLLEKRNYTTERAIQHLAKALHIPRKAIGYAGAKDKNAITKQYITIRGASKEKINQLELKDITLTFKGYAKKELRLGQLKGNKFIITIRGLKTTREEGEWKQIIVPNYFDEQRFSTNNLKIGLAILKGDYEQAVSHLENDRDAEQVQEWLQTHENDYVGALHRLPKKVLLFFVHSVQSYFFNEALAQDVHKKIEEERTERNEREKRKEKKILYSEGEFIFPEPPFTKEHLLEKELPLIGYEEEGGEEMKELLATKEIEPNNFINKQLPSLTLPGGKRKAYFKVEDIRIGKAEEDENHEGKYKQQIEFTLGKGSYATIVIKQLSENRKQ